jgi:hypothetical protein
VWKSGARTPPAIVKPAREVSGGSWKLGAAPFWPFGCGERTRCNIGMRVALSSLANLDDLCYHMPTLNGVDATQVATTRGGGSDGN